MNTEKEAMSRAETYEFLAAIFIQEPDPLTLTKQLQLLKLEAGCPATDSEALIDGIREQYFDCFFMPKMENYIPASESALLDYAANKRFAPPDGPAMKDVLSFYMTTGFDLTQVDAFEPLLDTATPDHVGLELSYMAYLATKEEDAREQGDEESARHWVHWQYGFLAHHLSRWLPQLAAALADKHADFYAAAAAYAADWVKTDLAKLEDILKTDTSHAHH